MAVPIMMIVTMPLPLTDDGDDGCDGAIVIAGDDDVAGVVVDAVVGAVVVVVVAMAMAIAVAGRGGGGAGGVGGFGGRAGSAARGAARLGKAR